MTATSTATATATPTPAPGETSLEAGVIAGATSIPVGSAEGFKVDDSIQIGSGATAEQNTITAIVNGSVIFELAQALQFDHDAGEQVIKISPQVPPGTDVPNADKANPGRWVSDDRSRCAKDSVSTTCSRRIDENIDTPKDDQFIESIRSPSNATVEFELTDAPAGLVTLTDLDVRFRASKTSDKDSTVQVEVLKADGTLLGTPTTETLTTTETTFSYTISGLSLTAADVDGLFVRVIGDVTGGGGGPPAKVRVQTINVVKTFSFLGDANLRRIQSSFSVLGGEELSLRTIFARVRNDGGLPDTIGVYLDVIPPGGVTDPFGCLPNGRILQTTVTLDAGQATNVFADTGVLGDDLVEFSCLDHAGAVGKTYTIIAVVDSHADDLASCGVLNNQSLACFNALADDDSDPTNNRLIRNAPRVRRP